MSTASSVLKPVASGEPSSSLDLGDLDSLLGFHVRLAYIAIYRDFVAAISELDLTQKQFAVMQIVAANDGPSQIDIANGLGMDRASMMALIDRLQKRDLVERRRSTDDRRRQELYLTPEGDRVLARAKVLVTEHEEKFVDRFSEPELNVLFKALRRIHRHA